MRRTLIKSDMFRLRTCFTRRKPPKRQLRPIRALHLPRHRSQRHIVATAATNFKQYRSTVGHALGYHSSLKFARFLRRFGKTVRSDTAHQGKAFLLLRLDRKSWRFRFIVEVKSAIVYGQPSTSLIVFDTCWPCLLCVRRCSDVRSRRRRRAKESRWPFARVAPTSGSPTSVCCPLRAPRPSPTAAATFASCCVSDRRPGENLMTIDGG